MLHIIFEISFEDTPTFEYDFTFSFLLALNPIPLISGFIDSVFSKAVP